ncbi:MAG: ATPase, partial [Bauldia sp.]|nr:ATPase [Bauldia sp.]
QFAYVASHDLQEPLRMVGSYLELLSRRYRGKLDAEADEFIGFAVDGATRMKQLINDLLGYSRVSNRPLKVEPVDMNDIMAAVEDSLGPLIEETGASIVVDSLPTVVADPVQAERLFTNLIQNAIKYRGEATPEVRVSATRRDRFWEFSVTDNGIGIDPQFREKVFEIFTRLHSREKYQGTGIGLAACKKIIDRHGGLIWIDTAPDGGCVFRFTLPVDQKVGDRK